jgi:hypothetical protein
LAPPIAKPLQLSNGNKWPAARRKIDHDFCEDYQPPFLKQILLLAAALALLQAVVIRVRTRPERTGSPQQQAAESLSAY